MTQRLSISVIIPTYNRAVLVQEAIDSLLQQTRVPDEIIVVDDGSTDDTRVRLEKYGPPVIVIHQLNRGRSAARNTGLRAATGDLIRFLDSDDTVPLESNEQLATVLEANPEYQLVYGRAAFVNLRGEFVEDYRHGDFPSGNVFKQLACHPLFPIHAAMFRRICIADTGLFDETLEFEEDPDFWLRMAERYEFKHLPIVVANYRVHENMSTSTEDSLLILSLQIRLRFFEMEGFKRLNGRDKMQVYSAYASRYAMLGKMTDARQWYGRAIQAAPKSLRPYVLWGLTWTGRSGFKTAANVLRIIRGGRWKLPKDRTRMERLT